ncbi:MAG TPA: HEAT repeat domain-containing protein, partial [Planctomycetota bacterium]|nr:HEAT repeat domain-containing protein [Planctomycetota bacterium]
MKTQLLVLACVSLSAVMVPASSARAALSAEREKEARALVAQFTDRRFEVRQQAVERLARMGPDVLPLVRRTLDETDDNEVRLRCRMVIDRLTEAPEPEQLVERVIRKLEPKPAGRDVRRTPDGDIASYVIQRDGRDVVVHNGTEQKPYDEVRDTSGTPDGKHIACAVRHEGKHFIVRDGVEQPPYDGLGGLVWSDDGRHLAYLACRDGPNGRQHFMVVDGVESPPCELVVEPRCSPDMKHIGYAAGRDGKVFFVIDGVEGPKHDTLEAPPWGGRGKLCG